MPRSNARDGERSALEVLQFSKGEGSFSEY